MAKELGIIIADFQTSLAGKIAIGDVSGTLLSATDDDGVILPDGRYFFTIDSDNSSKEHISCDLVGTTKAITNIKTVARGTGVETVGTLREHRIGATVTITDFAHIKKIQDLLDGTTDLDSDTPLKYDGDPTITDDKHLATKKYADDLAIAGSPDASTSVKGIAKLSVAPASPTEPIAVGTNDPRIPTADEKDALAGTSGTPSETNPFVTNDDTDGVGSILRESFLFSLVFGDGSDGDVVISVDTMLSRDMFYNNLTINNDIVLNPNGYRIFVKGTLINDGIIQRDGNDGGAGGAGGSVTSDYSGASGTAGTTGVALSSGTIFGSKAGQLGDTGHGGYTGGGPRQENYTRPDEETNSFTGITAARGGNGGKGAGGVVTWLTQTPPTITKSNNINQIFLATILFNSNGSLRTAGQSGGGAGGTGGASGTSPSAYGGGGGGGGAGSNGGIIYIAAKNIINNAAGLISVNGGNGGNGGDGGSASGGSSGRNYGGGGGGGGAGGCGGAIILIYVSLDDNGLLSISGGTGGIGGTGKTGGGSGANGNNGTDGIKIELQLS